MLGGGYEYLFASGTDDGSIILGTQYVSSGGLANATTTGNGGFAFVSSGGVASGTTVDFGSYEIVSSGGTINNATIDGGTLVLQSGGIGDGTITFAAGQPAGFQGSLVLEAAQNYGMLVAGFNDTSEFLDFFDINFATVNKSYTGNTLSGTLTLDDGGTHSASIVLLGNYTVASFQLSEDSVGGTLVTDPPQTAGAGPLELATPHHA